MEESTTQQEQQQKKTSYRLISFFQGVAFTICLLTLVLAIYLIIVYHTRLAPFTSYAIVFDAGSSHTEMFVYHWPSDKSNGLGTTSSVDQLFVCQLKGIDIKDNDPFKSKETIKLKSISDFENNINLLEDYFRPCLNEAISRIPESRQKISPIFLGATAGMRLLDLKDPIRTKQILEKIREIFSYSPFQFVVARQVRILTGIEEAIDGWITTNILLEKFKHRHTKPKKSPVEFDPYMAGVLDLGGASTQVTFTYEKAENPEPIPDAYTTNITLFDNVYSPYAHSYLCWGKGEALKRHRARLINFAININRTQSLKNRVFIRDPCLARGTNDTVSISTIFRSPCTANEKQKFSNHINISSITFIGSGNASVCKQRLIQLFDAKRNDLTVHCSYKREYCTFDHAFQPEIPPNINFIGLSGYYYVFNNLVFRMNNPSRLSNEKYKLKDFTQEEILRRISNVCETNYGTLYRQEEMTNTTEQFKRNLCFDSSYVWTLLTYGIGFNESDFQRIIFANKFPTGKVGWTLGYMINQTNYIPAEYREKSLKKNHFTFWLTVSILLLLLAIVFLLSTMYLFCRSNSATIVKTKNNYLQPSDQEYA